MSPGTQFGHFCSKINSLLVSLYNNEFEAQKNLSRKEQFLPLVVVGGVVLVVVGGASPAETLIKHLSNNICICYKWTHYSSFIS